MTATQPSDRLPFGPSSREARTPRPPRRSSWTPAHGGRRQRVARLRSARLPAPPRETPRAPTSASALPGRPGRQGHQHRATLGGDQPETLTASAPDRRNGRRAEHVVLNRARDCCRQVGRQLWTDHAWRLALPRPDVAGASCSRAGHDSSPCIVTRAALASHEPARGKRYSAKLKARIIEFAQSRRSEGASWVEISGDIGVAFETLRRWCMTIGPKRVRAMVPVRVVADEGRADGACRVRRGAPHRGTHARSGDRSSPSAGMTASELALFIEGCDLLGRRTLSPDAVIPSPRAREKKSDDGIDNGAMDLTFAVSWT